MGARLLVALLLVLSHAAAADNYEELRNRVNAAYQTGDTAALAATTAHALSMRPGHPTLLYFKAYAEAAEGRPEAALDALLSLYARDVLPPEVAAHTPVFATMHTLPRAARLAVEQRRLLAPVGVTEGVPVPQPAGQVPEGVAVARDGSVFLSSVRDGGIAVRRPDGTTQHWSTPAGSTTGLHLDAAQRTLWIAVAPLPQYAGAVGSQTGLVALDATTGKQRAWYPLVAEGAHAFGDFLLLADGSAIATDSIGGGVWRLDPEGGRWQPLAALADLRSPQGITSFGNAIVVADYGSGLYRYDTETEVVTRIADGDGSPYGIDGLYAHRGALIAVQNGVQPNRVARFVLDGGGTRIERATVLLMNHPAFDEPTLGQVDGDRFHVVANSHWNRFTGEHTLPDGLAAPIVLTLLLPND